MTNKYESGGKYGLKDEHGVIIIPAKYDDINQGRIEGKYNMYKITIKDKEGYISCTGTEYFED